MRIDIGKQWNGIGEEIEVTDCKGHVLVNIGPPGSGSGWVAQLTPEQARQVGRALQAVAGVAESAPPAPYLSPDAIYQALSE